MSQCQGGKEALNPVLAVRRSCRYVYENAKYVKVCEAAVEKVASEWSTLNNITTLRDQIAWDADNWHYCADVEKLGPKTCQYIFVLDSLNFCFWPTEGFEYEQLAVGLRKVLENDPSAFDAVNLANITDTALESWFPDWKLPNVMERVYRLQELGQALLETEIFSNGLAEDLVAMAKGSATKLVELILRYLPGFRDTSIYHGKLIHFYKRAQILVGDLWAAYGRKNLKKDATNRSIYDFHDMDQLTMFADYRVPQILRSIGIFEYDEALRAQIDSRSCINFGSDEEIEIRACTIIAVEMLKSALSKEGEEVMEIEIDWLLWQQGEKSKDQIAPHHRTNTIYY